MTSFSHNEEGRMLAAKMCKRFNELFEQRKKDINDPALSELSAEERKSFVEDYNHELERNLWDSEEIRNIESE